MAYKALIIAIWLLLPAIGLLLLRGDYERYQHELDAQQELARQLQAHYLNYSEEYELTALEVEFIVDPGSRDRWERRLRDIEQRQERDEQQLDIDALTHLSHSAEALKRASELLDEQRLHTKEVARLQDAYVKADNGMEDLGSEIFRLGGWADYYRSVGAWEIYLEVQEALAQLESQYRSRQNRRYELAGNIRSTMRQAEGYRREVQTALANLPRLIALDASKTYREELELRFARFDLLGELNELVTGEAQASIN